LVNRVKMPTTADVEPREAGTGGSRRALTDDSSVTRNLVEMIACVSGRFADRMIDGVAHPRYGLNKY